MLWWIEESYKPRRVLYPGSGADKIPRRVFGDRVVSVSREDTAYYRREMNVQANMFVNPFPNDAFDMVYMHDIREILAGKPKEELVRVLKDKGLLVLVDEGTDEEFGELVEGFTEKNKLVDITSEEFKDTGLVE